MFEVSLVIACAPLVFGSKGHVVHSLGKQEISAENQISLYSYPSTIYIFIFPAYLLAVTSMIVSELVSPAIQSLLTVQRVA